MTAPTVAILTPVPSPYQVELFDGVAAADGLRPQVVYLQPRHTDRLWSQPAPAHDHVICSAGPEARRTAVKWVAEADLAVFAWYAHPFARELLCGRARSGGAWCFWGERPGAGAWGWAGLLRRRWRLAPLRRSRAPIWGIGAWAVDGWRREFGPARQYWNVPYYSDLARFVPPAGRASVPRMRRFLFSGSLIPRKGADLLAEAFARLAAARPHLRLDLVGAGKLEPALKARLAAYGDRVRFLGFMDWPQLPAVYHSADVLVVPSRYDGWGLVVSEGLAAGLPVIATDRMGAALDLIQPGMNGWRVPAGDQAALIYALTEAANLSDAHLGEMSAAARASVARHSLDHGVRRFTEAAQAALAEKL